MVQLVPERQTTEAKVKLLISCIRQIQHYGTTTKNLILEEAGQAALVQQDFVLNPGFLYQNNGENGTFSVML